MADLIDRRAAIDAVSEYATIWMSYTDDMSASDIAQEAINSAKDTMIRILKEQPTVQPDHNADIGKKVDGDCISRRAAIDAFGLSEKTRKYGGDHSGYDTRMLYEIQDTLEDLPAVKPEIIRCKECAHRDEYGCCRYWKGQAMSEHPIPTDDYDFCNYAKRI